MRPIMMILIACAVCGCAAFPAGRAGAAGEWPPPPPKQKQKPTIAIETRCSDGTSGGLLANIHEAAVKTFRESGVFRDVRPASTRKTDLVAEIDVRHVGRTPTPLHAFFSGLTLFLIPITASDEFVVSTAIRSADGRVLGKTEAEEKVTLWVQTFLLPLAPFRTVDRTLEQAYLDMFRETIVEARQAGAI